MKYYDPQTRKRPDFESIWKKAIIREIPLYSIGITRGSPQTGIPYLKCECDDNEITDRRVAFEHWQQGHFDIYDEYKEPMQMHFKGMIQDNPEKVSK